jgi:hypothetical protein
MIGLSCRRRGERAELIRGLKQRDGRPADQVPVGVPHRSRRIDADEELLDTWESVLDAVLDARYKVEESITDARRSGVEFAGYLLVIGDQVGVGVGERSNIPPAEDRR